MTNKFLLSVVLTTLISLTGCQKKAEDLIQFVKPLIGTGLSSGPNAVKHSQGSEAWVQDIPAVSTPFGMTQWTPQTRDTENKCISPYYFGGKGIQGFRGSHWLGGSCTQDYGSFTIMPETGYLKTFATDRMCDYNKESEVSTPAYYSCLLMQQNLVFVEITGTSPFRILQVLVH